MTTANKVLLTGFRIARLGLFIGLAAYVAGGVDIKLANAASDDWVGVAAAVRGDVQLASQGAAPHRPSSGEHLFLGDRVTSGVDSQLQILLRDKTTFTLGADCDLTIDRFVYDPASKDGEIEASVTKGAFRFVTGEIPHREPQAFTINFPSGTIGVRGTIGEVVVGAAAIEIARGSSVDVASADPRLAILVVLRGPGNNLNTGDRIGQVVVSASGETITLSRPNWASFIGDLSAPPSSAFEIAPEMQPALAETLRPRGQTGGSEGPGTVSAGKDGRPGERPAAVSLTEGSAENGSVSADAGQDIAIGADLSDLQFGAEEQNLAGIVTTESGLDDRQFAIIDGPARGSDFLMRQGIGTFTSIGVPLDDGGSYDFNSTVNFDTRSWNSTAAWTSPSTFNGTISNSGTIDLMGNDPLHRDAVQLGPGVDVMLHERLLNRDGQPASEMWHWLLVSDGVNETFGEDFVQ